MKSVFLAAAALASVVAFSGQANASALEAQCDAQARHYAHANASPAAAAAGGAVAGGFLGGLASAIGGGDVATGVLAGAGIGAVGSTVINEAEWRRHYNYAYADCMNVSVVSSPAPAVCPALHPPSGVDRGRVVGSYDWKLACDNKYRSFEWDSWLFTKYNGCKAYCNL